MSEYTEYYNLKKPAQSEEYNVDVANTNNDIIDEKLFEKQDKVPGKGLSTNDFTSAYKQKVDMIQNIYKFKGSVDELTELSLIDVKNIGDVYNVINENKDYAWNGIEWTELGSLINADELATKQEINQMQEDIENIINETILASHPIGSIEINITGVNPSEYIGGTWARWGTGKVPVGVDENDEDFEVVEKTGGEKNHTMTIEEMPEHSHKVGVNYDVNANGDSPRISYNTEYGNNTSKTGGGQPFNVMQPYITCYMWKRIA